MSAALGTPADSLYASVRARLEKHGHRIDQADPVRRVLVVRPPGDDTKVVVRIVAKGDSSSISVVPAGNVGMIAGLRATLTVTHDATIVRGDPAAPPDSIGVPGGRWQPELYVSPAGRVWIARAGLFTADSLRGRWQLLLGGEGDPVPADDLRIGIGLAFITEDTVVLGLDSFEERETHLYRTTDRGRSWSPIAAPGVTKIEALGGIRRSVWAFATRGENAQPQGVFLRSNDGGATWERAPLPEGIYYITGLHRVSESVAYLSTTSSHRAPRPVFWRTTDGGASWIPIPTPHDQRVHEVPMHGVRIEDIAPVGNWLVVREYGRVFVTRADSIAWRPRNDLRYVAADRERNQLFALTDAMQAAMLDRELDFLWRTERRVPDSSPSDIVKLLARGGIGYVSMIHGEIYEARDGTLTLMPSQQSW